MIQARRLEQAGTRARDVRIDDERSCAAAGHQLEQLDRSIDLIHDAQAQHDVEFAIEGACEQRLRAKEIARRVDLLGLEHELGLLDAFDVCVDAEHVVGAGLQRRERPEPGAASEVEDAIAAQRSACELEQPLEQVRVSLALAIDEPAVVDGCDDSVVELEAIVPTREGGYPSA